MVAVGKRSATDGLRDNNRRSTQEGSKIENATLPLRFARSRTESPQKPGAS